MRAHRGRGDGNGPAAATERSGASPGKQTLVETIQRQAAPASAGPAAAPASSGSGSLPPALQTKMEHAFGARFDQVRVHEGGEAQALGASAYTQGTDLHFAPGQYQPGTPQGQELIGHELAHVVQQGEGRVATNT